MQEVHFLNIEYFFNLVTRIVVGILNAPTKVFYWFYDASALFKVLFFLLGLLLAILIAWLLLKIEKLRQEDKQKYIVNPIVIEEGGHVKNNTWEEIMRKMESPNPSDWKVAILEADKLLETMVAGMGYVGQDLGERLKTVEPSDFVTLNNAWEAHKVRNRIAHEPSYQLTRAEGSHTIFLYQKVFEEFDFI